jgi:hypothetical protein
MPTSRRCAPSSPTATAPRRRPSRRCSRSPGSGRTADVPGSRGGSAGVAGALRTGRAAGEQAAAAQAAAPRRPRQAGGPYDPGSAPVHGAGRRPALARPRPAPLGPRRHRRVLLDDAVAAQSRGRVAAAGAAAATEGRA